MKLPFISLFCSLAWALTAAAAEPAPAFPRFQVDDWQLDEGLPQNTVSTIVHTRDGYLWLGTYGGVVRFDGVRFTVFDTDNTPALKSNRILRLFEDATGTLWIGTEGGGLARRHAGKFFAVEPDVLGARSISALTADSSGALWVGSVGGQVWRYEQGRLTAFSTTNGLSGGGITALVHEPAGRLWVAAPEFLGYFERDTFLAASLRPADDFQLAPGRSEGLWLVNQGHLFRQLPGQPRFDCGALPGPGESAPKRALREDQHGNVWIATHGAGLFRYRDGRFDRIDTQGGLSHSIVLAVCDDRDGNLWAGTGGGGLNRLKERVFATYDARTGLATDLVRSVCEGHDGSLWIGTDGGGLHRLLQEKIQVYSRSTGLGGESNLWVGTASAGLFHFSSNRFTAYGRRQGLSSPSIRALAADTQGRLWIGTYDGGLNCFHNGRFTRYSTRDGLSHNDVRAILEDRRGRLWIGTSGGGLNCLEHQRFSTFRSTNGLPNDFVRVLYEDAGGALWIGTGAGLCRLKDGHFSSFTTRDGLPNDVISQIFEDAQGNFWIGSNRGIFRVRRLDLERSAEDRSQRLTCVIYDRTDGLGSRECTGGVQPSGWKSRDGRLWFPTIKGLTVVDPGNLKINRRAPEVVIEDFRVDDQSVDFRHPVILGPGADRCEIQYTGLSLAAPRRVRFKYRLEGLDPDWVEAGTRRVAYYTSLPPGKYAFHVIAANNDGVWNAAGASFSLTVVPPFWRTAWFLTVAFCSLGLLLALVVRFVSVRKLRTRLVALEHQQALERERARIARDMHDHLGASLTRIGLLGELVRRHAGPSPELAEQAGKITDATLEVAKALDEIVWTVNPGNDTLARLIAYIGQYADELFSLTELRTRFDLPVDPPHLPLTAEFRHHVFLAAKEALNNVVKHAQASEVHLRIGYANDLLEIDIEDDGRGLPPDVDTVTGNGLRNLRQRMSDLGGSLALTSQPGLGTRVCLRLQVGPASPADHSSPKRVIAPPPAGA
jgi:ligand-binding sensor domain-containing protein/signal transduction histidine kinase